MVAGKHAAPPGESVGVSDEHQQRHGGRHVALRLGPHTSSMTICPQCTSVPVPTCRILLPCRVERYDPISIWEIDMGDRTSMTCRLGYRYGIWDIDLAYGISLWLSAISIWSSWPRLLPAVQAHGGAAPRGAGRRRRVGGLQRRQTPSRAGGVK
jgi:hypothetical protein